MQIDILNLYAQARGGQLSPKELTWLNKQVDQYPYFALPRTILAKHHFQKQSPEGQRQLLTSSTFASNRRLLRSYILDNQAAAPQEQAPAESPKAVEAKQESAPKEDKAEVIEDSPAKEPVAKQEDAPKEKEASTGIPVGRVNWFLQTKMKMRQQKHLGKLEKLRGQLIPIAPTPAKAKGQETEKAAAKQAKENTAKKATEVKAEKVEAAKSVEAKKAQKTPAKKAAEAKAEKVEAVKPVEAKKTPQTPAKKAAEAKAAKPAAKTTASKPAVKKARAAKTPPKAGSKAAAAKEKNYEIGSFSSFTFIDDVDEAEEGEMDTTVALAPSVTLETPVIEDSAFSELVIEEEDRRLEVIVTPEELEKYFKGRLPKREAQSDRAAAHSRLQFDFQPIDFSIVGPPNDIQADSSQEPAPKEPAKASGPKVDALIERFIENEPTITRVDQYEASKGDLGKPSSEEDDNWVTETLGKIYAMQGNHAKAAKIYKKLALIFPEKSAYFDDLIQKLKK